MNRLFHIITLVISCISLDGQQSIDFRVQGAGITISERTVLYRLASTIVPITIQQYGDRSDLVFINLHDDEATSVEAVKRILPETGGLLIKIQNNSTRNIRFSIGKSQFEVDPNRIFAKSGIRSSLDQLGLVSAAAVNEVEKLGRCIIQLIPAEAEYVVALHNNTEGFFSAADYARGNKRSGDTKKIFLNKEEDTDDFFLTTDKTLYEKLADKGYNTILQDNVNCIEDGSLSVFCGRKNIRYINCETEHGKLEKYFEMIRVLIAGLN